MSNPYLKAKKLSEIAKKNKGKNQDIEKNN
jgi:hypothetical protein